MKKNKLVEKGWIAKINYGRKGLFIYPTLSTAKRIAKWRAREHTNVKIVRVTITED